jgi:CRISPR type III-B/RAMP module RAMP protein Cmr1
MKTGTFHLELITPCFCGGAEPEKQAEIRAPSIRGQLRWWFRTLGGFKSLAPMPVRDQEAMIFGSTAGDAGQAGKLVVRVSKAQVKVRDGQELGHGNFSDPAYLTFPMQLREKKGQKTNYAGRAVILEGSYSMTIIWRGNDSIWDDLLALVTVFGNLGALGFRGRRAMGAFGLLRPVRPLEKALARFNESHKLVIKELKDVPNGKCIAALGAWLKSWREHGRTPNLAINKPGFDWARRDHNEGYRRLTGKTVTGNPSGHEPKGKDGDSFRPALGLPIVQYFSSLPKGQPNTVMWDWEWDAKREKGKGRFASPVLLRPHRDAAGQWHALVIFVDAHRWPVGKQVYLNGQPRNVSLDLYNAMKNDQRLKPFP